MTVAEATASVQRFLDANCGRHRCVCIVHGQGRHSGGNVSVLKPHVRNWLRRHPAVLAFDDAPRTDGGAGAVYVLLRR
jgi:DNA-nicking Smr family endonuclease